MNNLQDMPPKCQNCPYWEAAKEPYSCWGCFDDKISLEGKLEIKSESDYIYGFNSFVEFHLSNDQPVLICLSKIVSITAITPDYEEGEIQLESGAKTWIGVVDDEIPVKETYDEVKKMVGA